MSGVMRGPERRPRTDVASSSADEVVRWGQTRGVAPMTAVFETVEGHTDRHALHEVWSRNDYRVDRFQVGGKTIVDIGANLGGFSVLAVKLGAARVMSYEPHPETFRALLLNLSRNGVNDQVRAWNLAVVGDREDRDQVSIVREGGAAGISLSGSGGFDVEAVSFSDVLIRAAAQDPLGRIGLMKIDCEACEFGLFADLDDGALSKVDRIALEFHGPAMPHLTYLDEESLGPLVCRLSEEGWIEIRGRASRGGMLFWTNYEAPALGRRR